VQAVAEEAGPVAAQQEPTGLPLVTLQRAGTALSQPPGDFRLHPDMGRLMAARGVMVQVRAWGAGRRLLAAGPPAVTCGRDRAPALHRLARLPGAVRMPPARAAC
jgi:hypothetical protein